jgi:hypothetical protein
MGMSDTATVSRNPPAVFTEWRRNGTVRCDAMTSGISEVDIWGMAETEEQKEYFGVKRLGFMVPEQTEEPAALIEQEHDGMEIIF